MSYSPVAAGRVVLSRELSDFLMDLLGAHQRFTMYPEGHPLLEPAVRNVLRRLEVLFIERETISLGVAPNQLLISGIPTDPNHVVLRDLASRLHESNIGAVKFYEGVTAAEMVAFLRVLSARRAAEEAPGHDEPPTQWPHIRLFPLNYDHLALIDEERDPDAEADAGDSWAARLWLTLARTALGDGLSEEEAVKADPVALARAIELRPPDPDHDERILQSLTEFTDAFRGRGRAEALALQRQLSRMVGALKGATRERLLSMGGDLARQKRFLFDVSQVMSADVVLSLVEAAASAQGRSISPTLLRLFGKLASHAQKGPAALRTRADLVFRQRIKQMIEGWNLDESPGVSPEYALTLERASGSQQRIDDPVFVYGTEPERLIRMSLELGVLEAGTRRAVDLMVERGQVAALLDLLEDLRSDDPVGADLRRMAFSPFTVNRLLNSEPVDWDVLVRLVHVTGDSVVGILLDALAAAKDRKVRAKLLDIVGGMGPAIGPEVAARIPGAPWFVQRNLLKLLGALPEVPGGFSIDDCLAHPDPRVRHEGLKILLRDPGKREEALHRAISAPDLPTVRLGVQAALEGGCPPGVVPALVTRIGSSDVDPSLRAAAVRALAPVEDPRALACLLKLTLIRSPIPFFRRLTQKSPEMLAALNGIAAHWMYAPEAQAVLALAAKHKDFEIRKAGIPHAQPTGHEARPALPRVIM